LNNINLALISIVWTDEKILEAETMMEQDEVQEEQEVESLGWIIVFFRFLCRNQKIVL
jgi:hypothetical protein